MIVDAFLLYDHQHMLRVTVGTTPEEPTPMVTFRDESTGQEVTVSAQVFFQLADAVVCAIDALPDGDQPETGEIAPSMN